MYIYVYIKIYEMRNFQSIILEGIKEFLGINIKFDLRF